MNAALMGSVSSSWAALEGLIEAGVEVTGVLGVDESCAHKISDYRPIGRLAKEHGLAFCGFERVGEACVAEFLEAHRPDLLWVIGLSQSVPRRLLEIARAGGIGFHPTMLPEGRGRAPVAWTILRGARAAVSLFFLTYEPDAGDLVFQREVPVGPEDYSEDLIARTNNALREAVIELGPAIRSGHLPRTRQDHGRATYYPKRTPEDGLIRWSDSTDWIYRLIRAAGRPYPGAFTWLGGEKIVVWRAEPVSDSKPGRAVFSEIGTDAPVPGTIVACGESGPVVETGDGLIRLTEMESPRLGDCGASVVAGVRLGGVGQ